MFAIEPVLNTYIYEKNILIFAICSFFLMDNAKAFCSSDSTFTEEDIEEVASSICSDDIEHYKEAVLNLMKNCVGTNKEKLIRFHKTHLQKRKCKKEWSHGTNKPCVHFGDNLLRTCLADHSSRILDLMIYVVDPLIKDPLDGLNTLEWLKLQAKSYDLKVGFEEVKKYYEDMYSYLYEIANPIVFKVNANDLNAYIGNYKFDNFKSIINISKNDTTIIYKEPGFSPNVFKAIDKNKFYFRGNGLANFGIQYK